MFRLNKTKSDKIGERIDFRLSHLQAIQVPKGWEKLFVSVFTVDTGKTIAKSSKASVRNGRCQWSETLSESIWISQDDDSKNVDCPIRLVIAMGSVRSTTLGEVVVNLIDYTGPNASAPITLPLKKCNYGTTLQFKVLCLTSRTKLREEKSWIKSRHMEEQSQNSDNDESDNRVERFDNVFTKSVGSSSSDHFGSSELGDSGMQETCFSASGSRYSSDSGEGSMDRASPRSNVSGDLYNAIGRKNSTELFNNSTFRSSPDNSTSKLNSPLSSSKIWQEFCPRSPLKTSDSPQHHSETLKIAGELCSELRKSERNAEMGKRDHELLRKQVSEQSQHLEELEMELTLVKDERDNLKLEIQNLKSLINESENIRISHKELEDDLEFHKESMIQLSLQLKKTQESNIEFVNILQEHEETIEKQKLEIDKLLKSKLELERSMKHESLSAEEWEGKVSSKEEEITILKDKLMVAMDNGDLDHDDLRKEIASLKRKVEELEEECNELGDENLKLILNLKESENGIRNSDFTQRLRPENDDIISTGNPESEIKTLKSCISSLEMEMKEKEVIHERFVSDLENQLQLYKEKVLNLQDELSKNQLKLEEKNKEYDAVLIKLESQMERNEALMKKDGQNSEGEGSEGMLKVLIELHNQLQMILQMVKKPWDGNYDQEQINCDDNPAFFTCAVSQKEVAVVIVEAFLNLHNLLEEKMIEYSSLQKKFINAKSCQEDIDVLRNSCKELELLVSDLQREKQQLEKNLEIGIKDKNMTSKCLEDSQKKLSFSDETNPHFPANKQVERRLIELESVKQDLEFHLSELEEENIQLSERISGLDAQLRHLTDERESMRLELENLQCLVIKHQNEIGRLGDEMETQKVEFRQKIQEAQKQLSESQEESEVLKRSNTKVQVTIESLMEECSSLQRINEELRRQRLDLHEHCTQLEADLRESRQKFSDCYKNAEILDLKLSSLEKESDTKEKSIILELETLLNEHKEHKEKLILVEHLLNHVHTEKEVEIEKLQTELTEIREHISSTSVRGKIESDATIEILNLRKDKTKLEAALADAQAKLCLQENEISSVPKELDNKIQELIDLLTTSKVHEEQLTAENDRMHVLMEDFKSNERKLKIQTDELDLKLKSTEYEKQQIMEENAGLNIQLLRLSSLQDEVSTLKEILNESSFEKRKIETSFQLLSDDFEELKRERVLLMEKISLQEKDLLEREDSRQKKMALEEKIQRLESDLIAREAICAYDAQLKNELSRMRRTNSQFQRKIQSLEEEKVIVLQKARALEEEVKSNKEKLSENGEIIRISSESSMSELSEIHGNLDLNIIIKEIEPETSDYDQTENDVAIDLRSKIQLLEKDLAEALKENTLYKEKLQRFSGDKITSLEEELKDMHDRYYDMSLRFADLQTEREELIMKIKSMKGGRR